MSQKSSKTPKKLKAKANHSMLVYKQRIAEKTDENQKELFITVVCWLKNKMAKNKWQFDSFSYHADLKLLNVSPRKRNKFKFKKMRQLQNNYWLSLKVYQKSNNVRKIIN